MTQPSENTHPLLPGIRSAELHNPDWPQTLHDGQITGFSPLNCGMTEAPEIGTTIETGGEVNWIETVTVGDGSTRILVCDSRLRLISISGEVLWACEHTGVFFYFGDLCGDGRDYVLLGDGPKLIMIDGNTGQMVWHYAFEPIHVHVKAAVGNIFSDQPGLEAAVFTAYGDQGCVFHFSPDGEPSMIWRRTVVIPDEWSERHDHGCDIKLDLSMPDEPVIWNVRHHRCRGFDARTGDIMSSLVYRIDGQQLRNYGPWDIGRDKHGQTVLCVASENVQKHVHGIRLNRDRDNELLWSHYYGEVYIVPGVAVEYITMKDVDGDGALELVYNVLDPARDYRAFVRVRAAATGRIKAEFADAWCVGAGPENCLLIIDALDGATPVTGRITVYRLRGAQPPETLGSFEHARIWGVTQVDEDLLLRHIEDNGEPALVRYTVDSHGLHEKERITEMPFLDAPVHTAIHAPERIFLTTGGGMLHAFDQGGVPLWRHPLSGGAPPTLSAADLNGDGRAELAAATAGDRMNVYTLAEGAAVEIMNREFLGVRSRHHSPLLYDLEGNGRYALITPGSNESGEIAVRAYRPDGHLIWETGLGVSTAQNGKAMAWIAGAFLPGPRSAVAVSVNNDLRNIEGTYLLDGLTGEIRWFKGLHWKDDTVRPFLPNSFPVRFDIDNDGLEEIMMDMLSYMAALNGQDGSFAYLRHTVNLGTDGALYTGNLYNAFMPVYDGAEAASPHWLVAVAGYGGFGLMKPDPTEGLWQDDHGYDVPLKIGLIDVDGDGVLEAGYALKNHCTFICRDLWTGDIKWTLDLPEPPDSPTLVADVDGDGKGEFLCGRYCIGTDAAGRGEIRWMAPVSMGWAAIADFDGDGMGEIACAEAGHIYILKAEQ